MKLYLIQHGRAASRDVDSRRPLTEEGRRDVEKIAAFVEPLGLSVDYLWHSRKMRAIQTADILAGVVTVREEKTACDGLAPNDDVSAVRDEIISGGRDVMIVGHMPFVSKLASLLLAGSESADVVVFRQAGIVCLSYPESSHWQVEWIIVPDLLV